MFTSNKKYLNFKMAWYLSFPFLWLEMKLVKITHLSTFSCILMFAYYSKTPVPRILKLKEKKFQLAGVWVIGGLRAVSLSVQG